VAKPRSIEAELERLLSLKATDEERAILTEKGIAVKNPTKLTLIAAALYGKAVGGDLSAIKEIFSRMGEGSAEKGGVIFIDDVRNTD
jgi:hypothetical protein